MTPNIGTSTGAQTCVEMTIFAQSPNVLPSAYNYGCRVGWKANTIYRELAATTTSASSIASSTSSAGPTTPMATISSTSVSSTPTSTPLPASGSPNRAWIAGAVIGPVVGTALIAVAVIWWRRRGTHGNNDGKRPYELGHEYAEFVSVTQYHEKDHVVRPVELPSVQQPSELGTYPAR